MSETTSITQLQSYLDLAKRTHNDFVKKYQRYINGPKNSISEFKYLESRSTAGATFFFLPSPDENEFLITAYFDGEGEGKLEFGLKLYREKNNRTHIFFDRPFTIKASNKVRTRKNNDRAINKIAFTYPKNDGAGEKLPGPRPYDPINLPKNTYDIEGVERVQPDDIRRYGPVKIRIDFYPKLNLWSIRHKDARETKKAATEKVAAALASVIATADDQAAVKSAEAAKGHADEQVKILSAAGAGAMAKAAAKSKAFADALSDALAADGAGCLAEANAAELVKELRIESDPGYVIEKHDWLPFVAHVDDEISANYNYVSETPETQTDGGYLLHYSEDGWTQGCIGIYNEDDVEMLAEIIDFFKSEKKITLEVK